MARGTPRVIRKRSGRRAPGVTTGRIHRSLHHLTVATEQAMDQRKKSIEEIGGGEYQQQFKIPFSGESIEDGSLAWATSQLQFRKPFTPAESRRESTFDHPVMTYGVELRQGQVIVMVAVTGWSEANDMVTGASVAIGILSPEATKFRGTATVVFQGYALPNIDDDEE